MTPTNMATVQDTDNVSLRSEAKLEAVMQTAMVCEAIKSMTACRWRILVTGNINLRH